MSKSILDFSSLKDRILHPFFSNPYMVDTRENITKDVYDFVICERNDIKKRIEMVVDELQKLLLLDCVEFYETNIKRFKNNHVNIYKLKCEAFLELNDFITENDLF
jgi:hypothetical protein